MNCDCINQGFLCREYWKNCNKCHGTGVVQTRYAVKTITIDEFRELHIANKDVIVCNRLYGDPLVMKLHEWCDFNSPSYIGTLSFAYLNKTEHDNKRELPLRANGINNIFFTEIPTLEDYDFFNQFPMTGNHYYISRECFFNE